MELTPPVNATERRASRERLEREQGGRVEVLKNRGGWCARFFKTAELRKLQGQTSRTQR